MRGSDHQGMALVALPFANCPHWKEVLLTLAFLQGGTPARVAQPQPLPNASATMCSVRPASTASSGQGLQRVLLTCTATRATPVGTTQGQAEEDSVEAGPAHTDPYMLKTSFLSANTSKSKIQNKNGNIIYTDKHRKSLH